MFATDFNIASEMYKQVTSRVPRVELHHDFLEQWADTDITTTKQERIQCWIFIEMLVLW